MLTRANQYISVWRRKLGIMSMSALRKLETKLKACVQGLEDLNDSRFPGNGYSDPAVKLGKLHHVDIPESSSSIASRAMEYISWDTLDIHFFPAKSIFFLPPFFPMAISTFFPPI